MNLAAGFPNEGSGRISSSPAPKVPILLLFHRQSASSTSRHPVSCVAASAHRLSQAGTAAGAAVGARLRESRRDGGVHFRCANANVARFRTPSPKKLQGARTPGARDPMAVEAVPSLGRMRSSLCLMESPTISRASDGLRDSDRCDLQPDYYSGTLRGGRRATVASMVRRRRIPGGAWGRAVDPPENFRGTDRRVCLGPARS